MCFAIDFTPEPRISIYCRFVSWIRALSRGQTKVLCRNATTEKLLVRACGLRNKIRGRERTDGGRARGGRGPTVCDTPRASPTRGGGERPRKRRRDPPPPASRQGTPAPPPPGAKPSGHRAAMDTHPAQPAVGRQLCVTTASLDGPGLSTGALALGLP